MPASLDKDDIRILKILQTNCRLSIREIADIIGKSPTAVRERIQRLERDGYIQGYVTVLNREKINKSLSAFIHVQLKEHEAVMMRSFEQGVTAFSEVMECYHMTGQFDYLLKVDVLDMSEYYNFIQTKLSKLSNVGTVQTFFVLKEAKRGYMQHIECNETDPSDGDNR